MNSLNSNDLARYTYWRCRDRNHILGVMQKIRVTETIGGRSVRFTTTRLLLFREAVDLLGSIPEVIDIGGSLDGRLLNMAWRCSRCGAVREWHPEVLSGEGRHEEE